MLADMQLISLLFTQVFASFGFAFRLAAIVGSADLHSGQNQASAVLSSSASIASHALSDHTTNSEPAIFDEELGAWRNFSDYHRPITYGHWRPCDQNEPYIDEQRFCLVGFGAGMLADMQLISLLFTQVFASFGFAFRLAVIVGSADLHFGQNQASAVLSSSASIASHALSDHTTNSEPAIFDDELGAWRNFSDYHRPITYGHWRPCDQNEPYIDEQRFCLVGFGAGTLADMQLISLLFTKVFASFGFAFRLAAIVGSADLHSGQNQASAVLSSSASIASHALSDHTTNSEPAIFDNELGAWRNFSDYHRPITYGHWRPCDQNEPYIDEQRFCLVGFGAGTLADMQLISLLFTQVCSGPVSGRYQYDKNYMSALFTNSTHALTFETEQSIKAKLCALKSKFLKLNFGISVYDIDADMEDKSCATVQYRGRYERLKLLKRILDFLKGYTAANMKKECENL